MKKVFHLREVLAIVAGLSLGGEYFAGLQEIYDFLEGDGPGLSPSGKRETLSKQFPQLADCGKDFAAEELAILRDGSDREEASRILASWIDRQVAKHGEFLEVSSS